MQSIMGKYDSIFDLEKIKGVLKYISILRYYKKTQNYNIL